MAGLKCKMCGGALPFTKGGSLVTCEYCGAQQILPRSLDDKLVRRFDLANDYRVHCEFDKAAILYDQILLDAPDDPEAYWGRVLCRYGIEYVTAKDGERTATCHRTQFKSILKDPDYLSAMRCADSDGKQFYSAQAAYIDTIQKGILSVSSKEAPFDIFICYKEKDETGARTVDSVIGQNLYTLLTAHGYRVFFARITLEDKLGTAYEPYIFSALNSARVMLVLGTKPEYFSAVWVKNEWSRYLSMMQEGKYLIPCYRDMSPYDMPEEFHALQAQNLSAIGFEQDLLHGIAKLIGTKQSEPAAPPAAPPTQQTTYIRKISAHGAVSPNDPQISSVPEISFDRRHFCGITFRLEMNESPVPRAFRLRAAVTNALTGVEVHRRELTVGLEAGKTLYGYYWQFSPDLPAGSYRATFTLDGEESKECFCILRDSASARPAQTGGRKFPAKQKSVAVYAILAFLFGVFGIHDFYAGRIARGVSSPVLFVLAGLLNDAIGGSAGGAILGLAYFFLLVRGIVDAVTAIREHAVPQKKKK